MPTMCEKASRVINIQTRAIYDDCFVKGSTPTSDNLLNVHFEGTLKECAFHCQFYPFCQGFSYDTANGVCYPKASFTYAKVNQNDGWISGPKDLCGKYITRDVESVLGFQKETSVFT